MGKFYDSVPVSAIVRIRDMMYTVKDPFRLEAITHCWERELYTVGNQAARAGLEMALDRGVQRLDVFLDSELVVRQVNGQYKVKDAGLKPFHAQACLLLSRFHEVDVKHVRREQNAEADRLVNEAIDAAQA